MYLWIVGAVLVLGGLLYSYAVSHPQGVIDGEHEGDVRTTVAAFGNLLTTVNVAAPDAAEDIRRAYGPYVSEELLARWMQDPESAPGRTTSSPWPDHIEVDSVTLVGSGTYAVSGRVLLATSAGSAGAIPVSITVKDLGGSFLITSYQEKPQPAPVAVPATLTLALNEEGSAHGVSLRATAIEDSRCPQDVTCVWAGEARVKLALVTGMGTSSMPLVLGGAPITTETATVTLTNVTPEPTVSEDALYRFTFVVAPREP